MAHALRTRCILGTQAPPLCQTCGVDFDLRIGEKVSAGDLEHADATVSLYVQATLTFLLCMAEAATALGPAEEERKTWREWCRLRHHLKARTNRCSGKSDSLEMRCCFARAVRAYYILPGKVVRRDPVQP